MSEELQSKYLKNSKIIGGEFDLEKQKELAMKYKKVEELKKEITEKLDLLSNCKISTD
ncbi:MAG: hypothetical protein ABH886_10650 [Candidatus Desantisbacteria bacterium]